MDYTNFQSVKNFDPKKLTEDQKKTWAKGFWWKQPKEGPEVGQVLISTADALRSNFETRQMQNLVFARLYGNFDLIGFGISQYDQLTSVSPFSKNTSRLTRNVIASTIDTLTAKICKNKPRAFFLTDGGNWQMQQRARRLNKFGQALFHETKIHIHGRRAFLDTCIFGTGALEAYIDDNNRVAFKRAFINDFMVDPADGVEGTPQQLLRRKPVSKSKLMEMYPEQARMIADAKTGRDDQNLHGNIEVVEVIEGWHLPSYPEAGDGRHVIALSSGVLVDEVWKLDCFPFIFNRYRERSRGFWGQGLAEILTGIQVALNRTFRSIDEQIRRKGKGRVFYQKGTVNPADLDNSVQAHVPYSGTQPPTQDSSNAVSQDELMHERELYQAGFQEAGISELSANAKKPSGLDAAVALREFNDIESERFIIVGMAYEQMYMDAMELALELIRKNGLKGYTVKHPNKRYSEVIKWEDINLEANQYTILMYPVSSLPSTPAAKLQRVEELRAAGYIDMPTAKRLLDYPDIDAEMSLANAAADDVDACISLILDEDVPKRTPIEPYQSLDLIIERGTASYLFAKNHGCDKARLQMLRDYIDEATAAKTQLLAPAQPPPGAPMPAAAPAPGGGATQNQSVNVNNPVQPTVPPVIGA